MFTKALAALAGKLEAPAHTDRSSSFSRVHDNRLTGAIGPRIRNSSQSQTPMMQLKNARRFRAAHGGKISMKQARNR